jgi:hypothetical protein
MAAMLSAQELLVFLIMGGVLLVAFLFWPSTSWCGVRSEYANTGDETSR